MKKNVDLAIISFLLITASFLRFYHFFELPFNSDELSALFRLDFKSLGEVLEKGVKVDGHPAGVQLFLYFWTGVFGTSEVFVKLPFILMGIASVYLVFILGRAWFNPMSGLVSASLVATLQYTIMYSQVARPYSSGLFFSLLLVYFWDKVIFHSNKNFVKNLLCFVLAGAACAYNHHFSLLFAFTVGITGLFYIKKEFLLKYIGAGMMVFILYIPHLEIFFYQLSVGGVEGWLAKPTPKFIPDYFSFIFHHSPLFIACLFLLISGAFFLRKYEKPDKRYYVISLAWFLFPLLVGYFYSVYFSAVLQYSVLIFTFPFLLFLLFGHLPDFRPPIKAGIVIMVCALGIYSLAITRNHFVHGYKSAFLENVKNVESARKLYGNDVLAILDGYKDTNKYYLGTGSAPDFYWLLDFPMSKDVIKLLDENPVGKVALGSISSIHPNIIPIILERYPVVEEKRDYYLGSYYLFSSGKENTKPIQQSVSLLDFESLQPIWAGIKQKQLVDSLSFSGKHSYQMVAGQEWGPTYFFNLKEQISHRNDFIDVSVMVKSLSNPGEIFVVSVIESDGETIDWRSSSFEEYDLGIDGAWVKIYHSVKLSDIAYIPDNSQLKVFIWNKGGSNFLLDDFEIKLRKGNPFVYGLFEDF